MQVLTVVRHPVGGIRTHIKYTYRHLDPNRYRFVVVSVAGKDSRYLSADLANLNWPVVLVRENCALLRLIVAAFRELSHQRFEIIHSHGLSSGVAMTLPARMLGMHHIITLHDVFRHEHFSGAFGRIKRVLLGEILQMATLIHCVSQDVKDNLWEYFPEVRLAPDKTRVVRNGVDVDTISTVDSEVDRRPLKASLGLPADTIIFGFLAGC